MCDSNVWFMDDRHLKSFWNYHRAALRWFKAHQAAREYAVNGSSDTININETDFLNTRTSNNDSLSDERQGSSSGDMCEDVNMSSEMAAFFRQTIEHRKQRDADRSKEAKRYKEDNCITEDHYVMADKIDVYGNEKRSFQLPNGPAERLKKFDKMKELYGTDAEKILAMEAHLDLRFEQNYSQPGAHLWPNIPLKL
ncbi:hypothetical protein WUBG_03602 [Wuchereria bancrofti]|nr:hypothetical protein WUBG_03602 [Wuchereria bancrofti]